MDIKKNICLIKKLQMILKKGEFFYNTAFTKANKIILNTKTNLKKEIRSFFPKKRIKKTFQKNEKMFY